MADFAQRPGFRYMDLDDFEEYLADKPENEKWELLGGRVVKMMVGARWEHHFITRNLAFEFDRQLRGRNPPCRVFTETFWLKEKFLRLAAFPDIMVRCGTFDPGEASLSDPVVLVEVVSPGSADRDRGEKLDLYPRLNTLKHYVLIERDTPLVEVLDRQGEREWGPPRLLEGLDAVLELRAIEVSVPLSAIYEDVLPQS
ncbi:MAG: hypothetical protein QOC72_2417 [Methylobacteriaceae bacterium]|jgi:Uma2 family endonuclease|nr:hypothetical protein [Methylobacteriaceae bacterium]